MFTGPSINDGTPLPATIALKLEKDETWIVGVNDGGYLKMVKLRVTGSNSFDWIATKYTPGGSYGISCLTSFQESCFVGTAAHERFYTVNLVATNQGNTLINI